MRECRQSMSDQMYCRVWAAANAEAKIQEKAARQRHDDAHDLVPHRQHDPATQRHMRFLVPSR